jgi:hypothetical protein
MINVYMVSFLSLSMRAVPSRIFILVFLCLVGVWVWGSRLTGGLCKGVGTNVTAQGWESPWNERGFVRSL